MRVACWITKATDTHSEYVILTAFARQQWLRERASLSRYTYTAVLLFLWFSLITGTNILLDARTYYWTHEHITGRTNILLDVRTYYWTHEHITGRTNILLDVRTYYWTHEHITGRTNILLDARTYYWTYEHITGRTNILLDARTYYWTHEHTTGRTNPLIQIIYGWRQCVAITALATYVVI
jgi:hypothetical protein